MRLYGLALFVHILGVIAMFAGFSMQQRAGSRLRRAKTRTEAHPWAEVLDMTRVMPPSGAVMVLITGAYLSTRFSARGAPTWIIVAVIAALLIGTVAITIVNRDFKGIAAAVAASEGSLSPDAAARIARPRTWSAHGMANGAALGAIWLMTMKPGPLEAWLAVLLPAGLGAIAGARLGGAAHGRRAIV
ncbi:MAG: DUF2269 family protein [Gemmatimonadales bacterium]